MMETIQAIPVPHQVSLIERLLPRLERDEAGCWNWQGPVGNSGYGVIGYGKGGRASTHRLAWLLFCGDAGRSLVLHRCDNRRCCNPDHLFLGTHAENTRDMITKGRHRSPLAERPTCKRGHVHDGVNSRGARTCSICHRAAAKRSREKRLAQ